MSDSLTNASADVLDIAEHFRRVLNELRFMDLKPPEREELNMRCRKLKARLESHGIDANALLHDRHWATTVVPGSWPTRKSTSE